MRALQVDDNDNVVVVIQSVAAGDRIDIKDGAIIAVENVPIGHKIARQDIPAGGMVVKYGVPIGRASRAIAMGSHVHTQNVEDITTQLCQAYATAFRRRAGTAW